jgi:hypothetical protein
MMEEILTVVATWTVNEEGTSILTVEGFHGFNLQARFK